MPELIFISNGAIWPFVIVLALTVSTAFVKSFVSFSHLNFVLFISVDNLFIKVRIFDLKIMNKIYVIIHRYI